MTRRHMEMLGEGSRRSPEVEEDFKRFTGVCKRGVQGLAPGQNLICVLWKQMMTLLQIGKSFRCYQSVPFASKPCWLYGEEMPIHWNDRGQCWTSWLRARVCSSENEKALWPFQFAYLIHGNSSSCLYSPRWRNSSIDSLISFVAFLRTAFAETLHFQDNFCHGLTSDQCVTNIIFNKPAPPKSRNVPTNPRNIKKHDART